jgi:hypothetical protein
VTHSENLIKLLHHAFDYTQDNNRDLLGDEMFPMTEVVEELEVQRSYQFLIAYISRNSTMINNQMED